MHTARTIVLILAAIVAVALGLQAALVTLLGLQRGLGVGAALAAVVVTHYVLAVRPWHRRWGTTVPEAGGRLPGDELVDAASQTTRAVAIDAPPEAVWPWMVQIGWGRAGWYSYDWIDNDRRPSADSVVDELQELSVGDRIAMTPDLGFVVEERVAPHLLVSLSDDGSTSWCLRAAPSGTGTRLVSRFRYRAGHGAGAALWSLISDPGAFVMERRMLLGIKARAEAATSGTRRQTLGTAT